jgi:hypothetical protein
MEFYELRGEIKKLSHGDLCRLRAVVGVEIAARERKEPIAYKCCKCDFQAVDFVKAIRHLESKHDYSIEAALASYIRIWA